MGPLLTFGVLVLLVVGDVCQSQTGKVCPPVRGKPSCVCKTDKGTIDLTPLDNAKKPSFSNIKDPDRDAQYTYNPCSVFSIKDCINAYICEEYSMNGDFVFSIANAGSEKMYIDDNGNPYVHYEAISSKVKVFLHCTDQTDSSIVASSNNAQEFTFTLSSCHACPGGCKLSKKSIVGLAGLLLTVFFLLGVVAYFVIGALILRFHRGATGKEMIPNKEFWQELPFLIKDGCVFSSIPIRILCNKMFRRNSDYSSIK